MGDNSYQTRSYPLDVNKVITYQLSISSIFQQQTTNENGNTKADNKSYPLVVNNVITYQ